MRRNPIYEQSQYGWFQLVRQRHAGGGGPTSTPAVESALATNLNTESNIANTEFQQSQQNVQKMQQEEAPAISLYQGLTSGDPSKQLQAASPVIGQIAKGYNASQEQILNSIPPGPARDYALSQLNVQSNAATSGQIANLTSNAFGQLASLGQSTGAFGLQQAGASLNAFSGATQTAQPVLQANSASKASTLGTFGQLIGAGGELGSAAILAP